MRVWRRVGIPDGQFILILNMNRFAPYSDNLSLELSESSEELALSEERDPADG
jgi:hypothetical protein